MLNAILRNLPGFSSFAGDASSDPGMLRPSMEATGKIGSVIMGETVAAGDMLYQKESDMEWYKADADAIGTMPVTAMALEAGANGQYSKVLFNGYVRSDVLGTLNRAYGTISITGDVADGEYFTIAGLKYSFETTGDAPAGAVKVDIASAQDKATAKAALLAAMATQTATMSKFVWGAFSGDVLTLYAKYPTYKGTEGNALTLVKSGTNLAVSGGTLANGNDGGALYAGNTAGAVQFTIPSGSDDVIQQVGTCISADEMLFEPMQGVKEAVVLPSTTPAADGAADMSKSLFILATGIDLTGFNPQYIGQLAVIYCEASTTDPTVKTGSGVTFDGTNNTATFPDAGDTLVLISVSLTRWLILLNIGAVGLTNA